MRAGSVEKLKNPLTFKKSCVKRLLLIKTKTKIPNPEKVKDPPEVVSLSIPLLQGGWARNKKERPTARGGCNSQNVCRRKRKDKKFLSHSVKKKHRAKAREL